MSELPVLRNTGEDYAGLMALAKELCTTGFLPVAVKTPAQAVAIILTGRELGLPPMQSLRSICIIQGKPELSADLQLSIFHRDGGRSKWLELTPLVAKVLLKHPNGDEHTETFTLEDAKRAGLAGGVNWQKYPKAMLRSRAITAGLKSIGFEPLTGTYSPGEIGGPEVVDLEPESVTEPTGAPAAPKAKPSGLPDDELERRFDKAPAKPAALKTATANTRAYVLDKLGAQEEGMPRTNLTGYLRAMGWLDADKVVEQWPYRTVPITSEEIAALSFCLGAFSLDGTVTLPYPPHGLDPKTLTSHPVDPPKAAPAPAAPAAPAAQEPIWKAFVMPFGKSKGKPLGQFPKPELMFYIEQFRVRESVDVQQADGSIASQALPPESIAVQKLLRAALDQAAAQFAKEPVTKG